MPNWVKNKVYIENKNVIKECLVKEEDNEYFDFNKVIPMPKSLDLTSGSITNISVVYAISKMLEQEQEKIINQLKSKPCMFYQNYYNKYFEYKDRYTKEVFDKENERLIEEIKDKDLYKELNIKDLEDLGNTYIKNIIEYGCDNWYDWCVENWGTKWNASDTYYIDENNIEFETAWSMPYEILKAISEIWDTKVICAYADEDIGNNCGTTIFEKGKEVSDILGDRDFALDIWGYDE